MTFDDYYINQAGTGIPGFQGVRQQRGKGWLGNIWKLIGMPLLKYAGKHAINTGADIIGDINSGESIKDSTSKRLKNVATTALFDAAERGRKFLQTGKGVKRKRSGYSQNRINKRKRLQSSASKKHKRKRKRKVNLNCTVQKIAQL